MTTASYPAALAGGKLNLAAILIALLTAACAAALADAGSVGGTYDDWTKYRDALAKDSDLLRMYTFDDLAGGGTQTRDLATGGQALTYGVVGDPGEAERLPRRVEGRWPGKGAVRLDHGYFAGAAFDPVDKSFTVAAWVRVNGLGALRGDAVPTGGTLLSVGGGYWDGWRVTINYPDKIVGFEIGRPQPSSSVGLSTGATSDGVWRHLAATWDGKLMRIYLDGLLAASGPYEGAYTPGGQFRIGFAGFGWGAVVLDVDEVAVYKRALSPTEIMKSALFYAPLPDALAARLEAATKAYESHDFAGAAAGYRTVAEAKDTAPAYVALARLRLGQALAQQRDPAGALAEFQAVIDMPAAPQGIRAAAMSPLLDLARQANEGVSRQVYETVLKLGNLSPHDRLDAQIKLAGSFRQEHNFAAARLAYADILKEGDLPMRDRLNTMLQLGHTAWEAGDLAGARVEYTKLVTMTDAPAEYRCYAELRIAQSFTRERNYHAAKTEYQSIANMADAPEHLRWEAQDCIREVERLGQGLPARDPNWSRTKLPPKPANAVTLYVAANGSDDNPGTKAKPFATLMKARDAIRAIRQSGQTVRGAITVFIEPGEYRLAETLKLDASDTGTAASPVIYCAETPGTVRLTGGVELKGFKSVEDPAVLQRIPEEARGKVMQLDLRAAGVTDLGQMQARGFGHNPTPAVQLFFDGKPMQLARWPNEGFVNTGKIVDDGANTPNGGATFEFDNDRINRWAQAKDAYVFGYFKYLWADEALGVAAIDPQTKRITLADKANYGVAQGQPFYVLNLLEELDQPGEWYLDRATGILYFYPPSDPAKATVQLSVLQGAMLQAEKLSNVTFQGLTFELGRFNGVVLTDCNACFVAGCTLRQLAGTGVIVDGGSGCGVLACDIYTLGRGGTAVKGGDRKTLTPGGHFVENCHIHDFSNLDHTYTPAVLLEGCGNRIAHNDFHDNACHAMRIEGNDHIIEFNNIHHVVRESDDQGGLDIFGNPGYRGNIFRYNFWHGIGEGPEPPCGRAGIRLDDAISGVLMYGNVFYRCSSGGFGGIQIHGGKDNVVDNNLFIDCKYGVSFSGWGDARWKDFLASEWVRNLLYKDIDITSPPHSTRYPALAHIADGEGINAVSRNVAYKCGQFLTRDRGIQDLMDNYVTMHDPGFVDEARANFSLKPNAAIFDRIGLRPIPFDEIGLYKSELRK
jgi:hypothetical protein